MISDLTGYEWTWGGVPSVSFMDGINPNITGYYSFDFGSPLSPDSMVPLP
jgi:hypothetical protein